MLATHRPPTPPTLDNPPTHPPIHPTPPLQDEGLRKLQRKAEGLEGLLAKHPLAASPTLQSRLDTLLQKQVGRVTGRPAGCLACHRPHLLLRLPAPGGRWHAELATHSFHLP